MDTYRVGILVVANAGLMGLVIFVVVMLSYIFILFTPSRLTLQKPGTKLFPLVVPTSQLWFCSLCLFSSFTLGRPRYFQKTRCSLLHPHCSHVQPSDLQSQKCRDEECPEEDVVPETIFDCKANHLRATLSPHYTSYSSDICLF